MNWMFDLNLSWPNLNWDKINVIIKFNEVQILKYQVNYFLLVVVLHYSTQIKQKIEFAGCCWWHSLEYTLNLNIIDISQEQGYQNYMENKRKLRRRLSKREIIKNKLKKKKDVMVVLAR